MTTELGPFRSTDMQIEAVPMTDAKAYTFWTAYYEEADVLPGDVVKITADFEVDNPQPYNAQICAFIGRDSGFGISAPVPVDPVFPDNGEDEVPHGHYVRTVTATDVVDEAGTRGYSLYLQTASTAVTPGAALRLDPGAGGIEIMISRPD